MESSTTEITDHFDVEFSGIGIILFMLSWKFPILFYFVHLHT